MKEQINLGTGDPDAEAPRNVVEAAVEALREGGPWTHYSHIRKNPTQDNFLEAVVDYYKGLGPTYELEQVIPTAGSGAALSIAMATLLKRGDEILMFEPAFMGYFRALKELGVKPVFAPLSEDRGFHPDTETLGEYVTPKTKAILLCSPNNPTGTVLTPEETQGIADVAIEHDLNVIADEIYLHYIYDDNVFTSISGLEGMKERTINVMSFSKTFSMTGWRLGYALVPERHLEKAKEKAGFINAMPATFVHAAGAVALREGWGYVDKLREEYLNRRNYFCDAADGIKGLSCQRAEGGFYAWVKIAGTGLDSQEFVERLAEKEKLTLTPGHVFGGKRDDYVRVALVRPVPVLEKAVERLRRFVESL
ncbi:MAG: pyridoxal phosphate-dependent aminotransferase [Candidatus Bathyarchaeia archaeon]